MRILLLTLGLITSSISAADWSLQNPSSIHFLTSKNTHVTEVQHFKKFDAHIDENGQASLSIDLSSVETNIDIRNQRMLEHLFEVSRFASANFEASIPNSVFKQVAAGKSVEYTLTGTVSLHGEKVTASNDVIIHKNPDTSVTVTAITPLLIDANQFKLVAGINKLQELAGLQSITHTVPVLFSLTFKQH